MFVVIKQQNLKFINYYSDSINCPYDDNNVGVVF